MKNKYKNKLFSIVLLVSLLVAITGMASAALTMQGGNVVGSPSDLASGAVSAGAKAVSKVVNGAGEAGSDTGINVDNAADIAASSADANAATSHGAAISATVAWGNSKNTLGGFAYDVNIGAAKPEASVETTSHAGVDISAGGESAVEYGIGNSGVSTMELPPTVASNTGVAPDTGVVSQSGNGVNGEMYVPFGDVDYGNNILSDQYGQDFVDYGFVIPHNVAN